MFGNKLWGIRFESVAFKYVTLEIIEKLRYPREDTNAACRKIFT